MDGGRFDAWVKRLSGRVARRGALGAVGAAVVGAIAGASLGPSAGAAQSARRIVTCEWRIEAKISSGPHRGDRYDGRLTLIGVGMANGRSLDFRLEGGECEVLAFTGVGTDDITSCDGRIAGSFQGPNLVDLGGWRTHTDTWCPEGERWNEPACGCVAACAEQTCPAGETLDPVTCCCEPGREDSACPGVICRGRYLLDTDTCQCYCPSDACPADGSWYLEPNTCECSCQLTKCPDGYEVAPDSCLCVCEKQECNGDLVWNVVCASTKWVIADEISPPARSTPPRSVSATASDVGRLWVVAISRASPRLRTRSSRSRPARAHASARAQWRMARPTGATASATRRSIVAIPSSKS